MILDTFEILFSTSAKKAREEVVALDKELGDLEKKGKKRSDEENKHYQELSKKRKELLDDLKVQQRETDKLGDSFQNMATNAIGAVTAFATFQGLKNTLIDVNKLNAALAISGDTLGLNVQQLKQYAAAIDKVGGNGQEFEQFVISQAQQNKAKLLPVIQPAQWIDRIRNAGSLGRAFALQSGVPLSALELTDKNQGEFNQALQFGKTQAASFDKNAQKAALENQGAAAATQQVLGNLATQINTRFTSAVTMFNDGVQSFISMFSGHPGAALAAGVGTGVFGGWTVKKIASSIFSLFKSSPATGAAATGEGAAGLGLSGIAGILAAGAAIGSSAWYLLGKEQNFINRTFSKPSSSPTSTSARQKIMDFWKSKGYGSGAAAGWTANAQAESSFNPLATNAGHVGLYQWSPARRAAIFAGTGIDVATASLDDQLKAAAWEASHMGLSPGNVPNDPRASAALISNKYEVPSLTASGLAAEARKRAQIASGYGLSFTSDTAGLTASGKTVNVKIDDVNVNTQATDAAGIATAVSGELKNQIRLAMSNFDDGVNY